VQVLRGQQQQLPKVKIFLDSIKRNSIASEKTYQTGLLHFQRFLNSKASDYETKDLETILEPLQKQDVNVYELLDQFVAYLNEQNLSIPSISLYVAAVRSYLAYYDIDVVSSKFKRKVKMPKQYRDEEQPIDVQDIRNLLLPCNNRRLKAYLLVLATCERAT
jgi:integrase